MNDKTLNYCGSGESNEVGYRVQVRCDKVCHARPLKLSDGIVSTDWRDVHFSRGNNPAGVPAETMIGQKHQHDLLSFDGALALAWTIIAQNELSIGLECRIVAYALKTTWHLQREGIADVGPIRHDWLSTVKLTPPDLANAQDQTDAGDGIEAQNVAGAALRDSSPNIANDQAAQR